MPTPPTPIPVSYYLAQERHLTELQFDQASTKKAETYPTETVKKKLISY